MFGFDATDWFIFGFVCAAGLYLHAHPSDMNYATFCGLAVLWHGLRVYDQKHQDYNEDTSSDSPNAKPDVPPGN